MAQSEDTELRDLVIEALEKNGSLAKIRALLRANIFLAFEDDYENVKQNIALDNILKLPEGLLSLSIVYEFLEFCNLKNTLFVYKSETRQDKEYKYEGQQVLLDKLNLKRDAAKEPVLVSMLRNVVKSNQRHYLEKSNVCTHLKSDNHNDINKDDQNCTYIVHEDSSCTSNSHSDNSSDEKTKLHLRLPLDNSDTDTSSDSTRDKSSSEYIPNEHIIQPIGDMDTTKKASTNVLAENLKNLTIHSNKDTPYFLTELKIANNSSSDSTSYAELKPLNLTDEKLLNTTGLPTMENNQSYSSPPKEISNNEQSKNSNGHKTDSILSSLNSISSTSLKNDNGNKENSPDKKSLDRSIKSETDTADYSFDFSNSGASKNKDVVDSQVPFPPSVHDDTANENENKNYSLVNSPHNNSQSSQSSVSISDVADLISEKSLSLGHGHNDNDSVYSKSKISKSQGSNKSPRSNKSPNNDSGDFSESPVPSLSNLSLDIHSD